MHCIDFDDEELHQLRTYFNSLDDDGSGAIGVDELEDPLIALGLVENRAQVKQIVRMVDQDGSDQIEFNEFLSIIKGGNTSVSTFSLTVYCVEITTEPLSSLCQRVFFLGKGCRRRW